MFHGWYDLAIEQQQYIDLTSNLAEIGNRSLKNHLSHGMIRATSCHATFSTRTIDFLKECFPWLSVTSYDEVKKKV